MASWERRFVYVVVAYAVLEIVVDNVLVFSGLTSGGVPSLTVVLLTALGFDAGAMGDWIQAGANAAWLFGVVGVVFLLAAVALLVVE